MADVYKIECYVETVSSDGNATVRGVDGYRLEKKEGEKEKTYNVFVNQERNASLALLLPLEKKLKIKGSLSWLKEVKLKGGCKILLQLKIDKICKKYVEVSIRSITLL